MYNMSIRRWSALEEAVNLGLDGSEGFEVVPLLGAFHAFGGEDAVEDVLPEELCNDGASNTVVDPLFMLGVNFEVFGTHAVELAEGVLIDIVIHLTADQLLEEVVAF